jgi:hypothetical protein
MNLDDLKVLAASVSGIGNWLLEIDILLKVSISLATLMYIIFKVQELLKKR